MNLYENNSAQSISSAILQELHKQIFSGELHAGDWLPPERDMAEQMGISRGSLHQAILALSHQGFVSIIPRRGTVVNDYRKNPTPQSLSVIMSYDSAELEHGIFADMMDFRVWMECECARLACTHIQENMLMELLTIAASVNAPGADYVELIYRFHYLLTQASGNSIFSMIFRGFEPAVRSLTKHSYEKMGTDLGKTASGMKKLIACLRSRDEDAAVSAVVELLSHGMEHLRAQYIDDEK